MSKANSWTGRVFARSPISAVNTILVGTFLVASLALAALGNVGMALLMAYFGFGGLGVALYARRPNSRDVTRLNAIEYRDERDKSLAAEGFAAVGVAALLIMFGTFIVMVVTAHIHWYVLVVLMALLVVWGVANSVAVRRR